MEYRAKITRLARQAAIPIAFAGIFIAPFPAKAGLLNGRAAPLWPPEYQQDSSIQTERAAALIAVEQLNRPQIRQVQQQLQARGHQVGEINGQWNARTEIAMRNFQRSQNLQVTGQLDEKTVERLGLNVDTFRAQEGN